MRSIGIILRQPIAVLLLFVVVIFVSLIASQAFAAQSFNVADGDTIKVKLSSRELTRIKIDGGGRIQDLSFASGLLEVKKDEASGEAYIKPGSMAKPAFSFFLKDDMGAVYTIVAEQHDIPSETLIIKPKADRVSPVSAQDPNRSQPYLNRVKRLIRALASNKPLDGFACQQQQQQVPLWREAQLTLERSCKNATTRAEVYRLTNTSPNEMVLDEREFLDFGLRVRAVALDKLQLATGEDALVYIVRAGESS